MGGVVGVRWGRRLLGVLGAAVLAGCSHLRPDVTAEVTAPPCPPAESVEARIERMCEGVEVRRLNGSMGRPTIAGEAIWVRRGDEPLFRVPLLATTPGLVACWEGHDGVAQIDWVGPWLPPDGTRLVCGPLKGGDMACFRFEYENKPSLMNGDWRLAD